MFSIGRPETSPTSRRQVRGIAKNVRSWENSGLRLVEKPSQVYRELRFHVADLRPLSAMPKGFQKMNTC